MVSTLGASTTPKQVDVVVDQVLPLLVGGAQYAAGSALSDIGRVIQSRQEANRGLSSGDEFYGDKHFWMKPFGSWTDQDDRNGISGFKARTGGIVVGADAVVSDKSRLGLSFAYARASIDGKSSVAPNSVNLDVYSLLGYGSYALDPETEINYQVGFGQNKSEGRRSILFAGLAATSEYYSQTFSAGLGLARTYKLSEQTRFIPSVRADYTRIEDDAYTEQGAGGLGLRVNSHSADALVLAVDGKIRHDISKETSVFANLGVGYDTINQEASVTSAFSGAPTASFTTKGLETKPWIVRAGLSASTMTASGMEFSAHYHADYRSGFRNQTLSAKLRWAF